MDKDITYADHFKGYPIMTDSDRELGCDRKILTTLSEVFDSSIQDNSRVFFMRFDLRFPEDMQPKQDNTDFSKFNRALMKNLKRNDLNPRYMAVREESREKKIHYHEILLLDGEKTQDIQKHINKAEELWDRQLGLTEREGGYGLVNDCTISRDGNRQENGVMLKKNDPDYQNKLNDCFYRSSYLAKVNTKGNAPYRQREVFASRTCSNSQGKEDGGQNS